MINYDEMICGFLQLIKKETDLLREGKDSKILNFGVSNLKSGEEYEVEISYEKASEDNEEDKFLNIKMDVIYLTDFIVFNNVECAFTIEISNNGIAESLNWLLFPPNNELTDDQKIIIANGLDNEGWHNCGRDIIKDLTDNDYITFYNIISNINYLIEEESKQLQYNASQEVILDAILKMINEEV